MLGSKSISTPLFKKKSEALHLVYVRCTCTLNMHKNNELENERFRKVEHGRQKVGVMGGTHEGQGEVKPQTIYGVLKYMYMWCLK